ncbi:MAG: hypothetical protein LBG23_04880 [Endomicrobium sp.]|jgi:hypothetical protein|nr:hypothetical protein [Endomicrobium sp.]
MLDGAEMLVPIDNEGNAILSIEIIHSHDNHIIFNVPVSPDLVRNTITTRRLTNKLTINTTMKDNK